MSDELETINPDQVPVTTTVAEDAYVFIQRPGEPIQRLAHKALLSKLIKTDLVMATETVLQADLAHDVDTVAIVINDPDPYKCGWYRKVGASGSGEWLQFECFAKSLKDSIDGSAAAALAAAGVRPYGGTAAGLAATLEGQTFWVDNGDGIGITYRHDAGPVATEIGRFVKNVSGIGTASLLGANDGASGTLWSSVQGFIDWIKGLFRPRLSADRTFYVRTDGNDGNTGLTDSAVGAFATWEGAVLAAQRLDFNGYKVVIKAGAETGVKTWNFTETQIRTLTGGGKLYFRGNGDNTVLNASGQCFSLYNTVTEVFFGSMKLLGGSGYGTITSNGYSPIYHDDEGPGPNYGASGCFAHIFGHDNGSIINILGSSYEVSGDAQAAHIWIGENSTCAHESNTISLSGLTAGMDNWYAVVDGSRLKTFNNTFTGSYAGRKGYLTGVSSINNLDYATNQIPGTGWLYDAGSVVMENGIAQTRYTNLDVLGELNGKTIQGPGLYTPTITAISGSFAIAPTATLSYSYVNGEISISGTVFVPASGVGTAAGGILITPPAASTNVGAGSCYNTATDTAMPLVYNKGGDEKIRIVGNPTNNTYYTISISWAL